MIVKTEDFLGIVTTSALVEELAKRPSVHDIPVPPNKEVSTKIEGPARILVVFK